MDKDSPNISPQTKCTTLVVDMTFSQTTSKMQKCKCTGSNRNQPRTERQQRKRLLLLQNKRTVLHYAIKKKCMTVWGEEPMQFKY